LRPGRRGDLEAHVADHVLAQVEGQWPGWGFGHGLGPDLADFAARVQTCPSSGRGALRGRWLWSRCCRRSPAHSSLDFQTRIVFLTQHENRERMDWRRPAMNRRTPSAPRRRRRTSPPTGPTEPAPVRRVYIRHPMWPLYQPWPTNPARHSRFREQGGHIINLVADALADNQSIRAQRRYRLRAGH